MRGGRLIARAALAAVVLATGAAVAQDYKRVGDWFLSVEPDRFGDGGTRIAVRFSDVAALAVRCIRGGLTVMLDETSREPYRVGDAFVIKFRADREDVVTTVGGAISTSAIQVDTPKEMVGQIMRAREVAFRVTTAKGLSHDRAFIIGKSTTAVGKVIEACPLR